MNMCAVGKNWRFRSKESDYLPFGTENVITSTLDNNYKFIAMERDFEGTAALDHTLYRQYAPNLARWTTPDPVHGDPANPQTWNRTAVGHRRAYSESKVIDGGGAKSLESRPTIASARRIGRRTKF